MPLRDGPSAGRAGAQPVGVGVGQAQGAGAQDALGLLALVLVEALDEQHAVEVVDLVLEDPGQVLVGLDRDLVAVEVEPGQVDLLGTHDRPRQAGDRETPSSKVHSPRASESTGLTTVTGPPSPMS